MRTQFHLSAERQINDRFRAAKLPSPRSMAIMEDYFPELQLRQGFVLLAETCEGVALFQAGESRFVIPA